MPGKKVKTSRRWTKITLSVLLGLFFSAAGFWFAFQNVPMGELGAVISTASFTWLAGASILGLLTFVIRAHRWKILLSSNIDIPVLSLWHPMIVGFMLNCILPGRIGEVVRPGILTRTRKVPFSLGIGTVAAERIFDTITLVVILAWAMEKVDIAPGFAVGFKGYTLDSSLLSRLVSGIVVLSLILGAAGIIFCIPAIRSGVTRGIRGMPALIGKRKPGLAEELGEKFFDPLARMTESFFSGFSAIRDVKSLAVCLVESFLVWILQAVAFYMAVCAFPGILLTPIQGCVVFVLVCIFIAMPSVPGFWGLWEAGGVFGMAIFGVPATKAAAVALASHAAMMFPVIIAGMVSAWIIGFKTVFSGLSES